MKTRQISTLMITLMALSLCLGTAVQAADSDKGWRFDLAPFYLWAISLDGDISIGSPAGTFSQGVRVPFDEVFSNLESAFIFHFEGAKDNRWGFLVDYNYLDISGDQSLPQNLNMNVEFKATIAELAGFYRIAAAQEHHFDVLLGARYTSLEPSVTLSGLVNRGVEGSQDWVDPFVGLRWNWQLIEQLRLIIRGDVGGFGVGSDIAWQAGGYLYWQPWRYIGFIGGYRGLYQKYEDGSGSDYFEFDVTTHGPVLGLNITW